MVHRRGKKSLGPVLHTRVAHEISVLIEIRWYDIVCCVCVALVVDVDVGII